MSESFILYTSDYQLIEGLTDAQIGQLSRALFIYARDGEVVNLDPVVRMAFVFIKDKIDRNQAKYDKRCERNRQIALEREKRKREARQNTIEHERAQTCTNVNGRLPANTNVYLYDSDSDSDSDSDVSKLTDNNIIEPSKEASKSKSGVFDASAAKPKKSSSLKSKKQEIDFKAIKDYWNEKHDETNSAMRRLTLMSDQRKSNIRARLREYGGDVTQVYKAIDIAMRSDFMNGKNGKGWVASFDWIMCPANFPKVLEGNYTDERPASQQPQQGPQAEKATSRPSLGERYEQAKHQQRETATNQDGKYMAVISSMLEDLKKNPGNRPAQQSLERFYEAGVLQRLGIDWKPEK